MELKKLNVRSTRKGFTPVFKRIDPKIEFDGDCHFLFRNNLSSLSQSTPPNTVTSPNLSALAHHIEAPYYVAKQTNDEDGEDDADDVYQSEFMDSRSIQRAITKRSGNGDREKGSSRGYNDDSKTRTRRGTDKNNGRKNGRN